MRKTYLGVGIAAVLMLLAFAAYFILVRGSMVPGIGGSTSATSTPHAQDYLPKSSGRAVPDGQKEYYTPQYVFSLLYPDNLKVQEYAEQGGGQTVTFQYDDGKTVMGFQIFIAPFSGTQITEERFKLDEPSGVRTDLKNIKVDGATGASFYSKSAVLGDTAEVWFVRGGYLYEVTTFKELAPWLADIIKTWKFTK